MIDYFLKKINEMAIYQPYLRLPEGKRKLVHPTIPDDELFAQEWMNEPHVNSKYREDELTYKIAGNERVRSKSEIIIASILDKYNIPYKYEMPIFDNKGRILARPDFTVLNVRKRKVFYWEHFGMMDDNEYVNKTIIKHRMYTENGIYLGQSLICTYESLENPIDVEDVERIVKAYLL